MKNQFKIISIGSLALVIVLSIALSNSKTEKVDDTVKYINSSAKVITYEDFNDMDSAELIVKGTKDHVVKTIINKNK